MRIIELLRQGADKPFGIIGINDKKELFVEGVDKEYFLDWLSGEIDDEDGNFWTHKDGDNFLKAASYKLTKNVYFEEMDVKGPFEVSKLPELEELPDKGNIDDDS